MGSTITLTGSGTAATTNPWTSSATNFATITSAGVATGVSNGNTTITFTDNNRCTATTQLSVGGTPPVAGAGPDKEICAGNSVLIGAPAQSGVTYSWAPATGLSASNEANPEANPTTTTTYTLTAGTAGRSTTDQVEVKVNPQPALTSAQGAASFIRPDATIELTASTDGRANSWRTGDDTKVTIAAGTDPKKATATGVALGTATLTYTDVKGCIGGHLVTVSDRSDQTIYDFDPITDKTVGGADFTLSAKATSKLSVTFSTKSDKVSIKGSSVKIMKVGKASIEADQAGNEVYNPAPQLTKTFCINPATPTATYSSHNKTLTSTSAEGNQWFLNGEAIPGATAGNYTVTKDGSYTVKVTIEDCVSAPSASRAIVTTGDMADGEFQIFPNPVHDQLVIELPSHDNGLVSLFSITGQNLYSTAVSGKTIIHMKSFPVGIYILKIQTAGKIVVKKVVRK